jgi:tyrosine-protein kinase Etk/Wzc
MGSENEEAEVRNDGAEKNTLVVLVEWVAEWRRFIIYCVLGSAALSVVVSLLITPDFKSMASVFPAEEADLLGSLGDVSSLVSSLAPKGLTSLTADPELDKYIAILNSGRVLGEVIKKFDLVNVYGITDYPREKTSERLLDNVEFSVEPEGNLTITVFDEDPQRAADMANYFVEQLNETNSEIRGQNARANREYVEERYKDNIRELATAEDSLREFQHRYGVVALQEQTEASIKAGADLGAQLAVKEVQLRILKQNQSDDSPVVKSAELEVSELRRMLVQMNSGVGDIDAASSVFVPFKKIPQLGTEYIRRFRDVEIQNEILKFLTPLYEQAKVEERRQTPSVLVLDKASPAERKSRPKRLLIVIISTFLGFVVSVSYVALWNRWMEEKSKGSRIYVSTTHLIEVLSTDVRHLFKRVPQ